MATEKQLKLTDYYYTKEDAETNNNKTEIWHTTTNHTRYPTEKLVKDSLDGKVDKETDMGLSQNSFTDNEKSKLNDIAPKATAVSFTRNLNSGTKIGELKINDITTELFCNNDTNTLYYGDENTIIKDSNNKFSVNTIPISKVTNLETTLSNKANSSDIPTNTNQLTNGAGFITANDNSITKKLDKDDSTYQSLLSEFGTYKGNLDTLTNEYNTHSHGNITRTGTITSSTVNSFNDFLVTDSNNKIQKTSNIPHNKISDWENWELVGSYGNLTDDVWQRTYSNGMLVYAIIHTGVYSLNSTQWLPTDGENNHLSLKGFNGEEIDERYLPPKDVYCSYIKNSVIRLYSNGKIKAACYAANGVVSTDLYATFLYPYNI